MRRLAFALCCLAANGIAFASGPVAVESLFTGGELPEGWRGGESSILSPTYSNYVSHISLAYGEERAGAFGTLALFAVDPASQNESKLADLNTLTSAAQFDFPVGTDFRAFRLVTNGVALMSFTAVWMDTRLAAPTNIAIANNTGSSFDISWDPIADARTYKISVWTNKLVGAADGAVEWRETFRDMDSSKTAGLNETRLAQADNEGWATTDFFNGYLIDNGGGIRLGTSTATGWISVPHVVAAGENALRVTAARYSQNKGQQLAVLCVRDGGATTNLVGTFPVDFDGTYPTFDPSNAVDVIELPDSTVGETLILQTVSGSDGKEARIALTGIEFVSGYSAGTQVRDVIREETLSAADTACTISGLPPVAVQVSVQALAANATESSEGSVAVTVDLAHPPPVPQLAVSGARVADVGYSENFDALNGLGTSADWTDGLTLPYWQARKGEVLVDKISTSYGMGGKSGKTSGLYAYHGTNQSDTASCSLAAVANSSNKMKFGIAVTNDMEGFALSNFAVSFTARQWTFTSDRKVAQSLHFEYLVTNEVGAVSAPSNCWHEVEALRFDATGPGEGTNSLAAAASVGKADWATGSAFANLEAVLEGVLLHSGEVLMLRWRPDPVSNGEVLGVDDVSITCSATSLGTTMRFVKRGYGF